jgi:signal transduction histidine kinase
MVDEVQRPERMFEEQIPALAWGTDSRLRILWTVGGAFHAAERSLVGKTLLEVGEISERSIRAHQDALRGESSRFESRFRDRIVQLRVEPVRDDAGGIVGTIGLAVDVTDRKRAEEELAHRLQQQAAVAQLGLSALRSPDLKFLLDESVSLVVRTLGAEAATFMERLADGDLLLRAGASASAGLADLSAVNVPVGGSGDSLGVLGAYAAHGRSYSQDDLHFLQAVANVLASAIARDRVARELLDKREQLQAISHRLLEAQEAERRSVARELHDDFGQLLTAIRLSLQGGAHPAESISLVDDAIQRMRDLALDLRPAILDDLGLEAALRWYVAREAGRAGLAFRFDVSSIGARLAPALETACFRLVQEALTNVVRHGGATAVAVTLDASDGEVRVSISDDGKGFDVRAARRRAAAGGSQGLLIMEERVSLAGGKLEIRSGQASGTTVAARIPLPEASR